MENEQNELRRTEERNKILKTLGQEDIFNFLERKKKAVNEGCSKGYLLYKFMSDLEKTAKSIKDEIFETVKDELKDEIVENGLIFKVMGGSGRYDFSESSDWNNLKEKMKLIEEKMKISYKTGASIINEDTGEIYESAIFKPYREKISITKNK